MDEKFDKVPNRIANAASPVSGLIRRAGPVVAIASCLHCGRAVVLLPGLTSHNPWKQDETYITDIVRHMLDSGDWTVPTLAGAPFMKKPAAVLLGGGALRRAVRARATRA